MTVLNVKLNQAVHVKGQKKTANYMAAKKK
jgi:hypothetical protein